MLYNITNGKTIMKNNIKMIRGIFYSSLIQIFRLCAQAASYQMNNFPFSSFSEYILYKTKKLNKKTFQETRL